MSTWMTLDGNEATAAVAHRLSEVIAIYPITPASSMGELADEWSANGRKNLWGQVPSIIEMQSEGGAAGTVHGALQAGALATTFTASQGLLLMIPNLYKITGELTPFVLHVAARSLATHALSIFCDHSDVMACRGTGMAMLCSNSVQEAQDMAAIAHAATLETRVPFLHFFDGFRTSHELSKIETLDDAVLRKLIQEARILEHRQRALNPDHPVVRGTAQNPDVFFQAREAANPWHDACSEKVAEVMERFGALTGRHYQRYEYTGDPAAERVLVLMGSATETAKEAVAWLNQQGQKVGVLAVRLFRPLDGAALVRAIPETTKSVAVLDRTKEPGAQGEPLYLDVVAAFAESERTARIVGGRYGLGSKEVTPAMLLSVFAELSKPKPRNHFTVGIVDDVSGRSLPWDDTLDLEAPDVVRAVFYGLGSDGTVSSNKQSIKIISEEAGAFGQGYFVYDSKKSGAITVSHLRFGPRPIQSSYLIKRASFVACHAPHLLANIDMFSVAAPGATFLLNTPHAKDQVWRTLPREVQAAVVEKKLRLFVIDAFKVAKEAGLERRISAVMQTCFFALSGVLPREEALEHIRKGVEKAYGKRGPEVVRRNHAAIDRTLENLFEVQVPSELNGAPRLPVVSPRATEFVRRVTATMLAGQGDQLPVSAFPPDGTWPVGTTQWEKRGIGLEVPVWDASICIQCNKCALICPHAAIRAQLAAPEQLADAPTDFVAVPFKSAELGSPKEGEKWRYTIQVAPDDCTGCGLCASFCPAKDKANPRHKALQMTPIGALRDSMRTRWDYFLTLPELDRAQNPLDVKGSQFLLPLFEYSGACAGCGETPYLKLLSQLFGDRALVANATGCSSIYGGNLPTTPWRSNDQGRGPAWSNSLFEDNAEFGLGFRLAVDAQKALAELLLTQVGLDDVLVDSILKADQSTEAGISAQRARIELLKSKLSDRTDSVAVQLRALAGELVRRSVWIVGGDGWAYDIGYGGLDHVLATGADVNLLVLDTEVYSNTGGQQSKATPMGAAAKFAAAGKSSGKKDLGLLAMTYGNVYVASVAMGAKDAQTVKAFREAESWPGPSLIIAYSHCIAHGYDLVHGADQQKLAVDSGIWPLFRFDPRRIAQGEAPLTLDSVTPKIGAKKFMENEGRFRMVELRDPKRYEMLVHAAEQHAAQRRALYEQLAGIHLPKE